MSGFDSNPFADPSGSNPFGDPAAGGSATQQVIDEYNPFSRTTDATKKAPESAPRTALPPPQRPFIPPVSQPAIMQPTEAPPAYSAHPGQAVDTSDLQKRQEELERKAAELQRKEQDMRNMQYNNRQNNWPPLPKWCPVGPCFYQDISLDIPGEFQRIVRFLYYLWMFHAATLFLNILGGLAYFIADGGSSGGGVTFGLAILYFVLFTPCSFVCWFRPIYKAFRNDSSFNFMVFFFIFSVQFVINIIQAVGISGWGSCGFITAFFLFGENPNDNKAARVGAGVFVIIIAGLFAFIAVADFILLVKVSWSGRRFSPLPLPLHEVAFSNGNVLHSGVINGLSLVGKDGESAAGIIVVCIGILFAFEAVAGLIMLIRVHRIYRSTGASFQKAQAEFASGVMKNEHVQDAAAAGVRTAANQAVNQAVSGNRY